MRIKVIFAWLVTITIFTLSVASVIWYIYTQHYVQDSTNTATTGIFFQQTLNLDEYKNVSSGNGWLGKYDRYTRSDRHTEVLTIYCNTYCKK